jgi:hypothetical protein
VVAVVIVGLLVFFTIQPGHRLGGGATGVNFGVAPASSRAAPIAQGKFGKLPAPTLVAVVASTAPPPAVMPYVGPADVSWSGVLPELPASAPVYSFQQAAQAEMDSFTGGLGLEVGMSAAIDTGSPEPRYSVSSTSKQLASGPGPADADARKAADSFLSGHGLTPSWPYDVVVIRSPGAPTAVHYYRKFAVPGAGDAQQIDRYGERTGTMVWVGRDSSVYQAEGPLPRALQSGAYPLRQPQAMIDAALTSRPVTAQPAGGTVPKVILNSARLVYLAVAPNFYEPALLFTGSFAIGNQLYEKRVLVPAIDRSQLLSP